jgi:hypothetical protein
LPNENQGARNKIDRKHVDFLLCEPKTFKLLLGVELDDASHQRAKRVARDRFVDEVFERAGLPLLRVLAKRNYDPESLSRMIGEKLGGGVAAPKPLSQVGAQPTQRRWRAGRRLFPS